MGSLLNDREKFLFHSMSIEVLRLAGVDCCVLWHFEPYPSVSGANPDCLYGEPVPGTNAMHYTAYRPLAYFKEPTHITDALDSGELKTIEGQIYFSRQNLDDLKVPSDPFGDNLKAGDIVQLFRKGKYWYFDLKNVERTGWVNDSQTYTHYVADMVRNTDFRPEQKLED